MIEFRIQQFRDTNQDVFAPDLHKDPKYNTLVCENLHLQYNSRTCTVFENEAGLVLLHGNITNPASFPVIAEKLISKNYTVLRSVYGQFAMIVFNREKRELVIIRDQMGVNTLYYHVQERRTDICSHWLPIARTLPNRHKDFNWIKSLCYTEQQDILNYETLVRGVFQLPEGRYAVLSPGKEPVLHTYWDTARELSHHPASPEKLSSQLEELLREIIRDEIGGRAKTCIMLSGGLDSSIVANLAAGETALKGYFMMNPLTFLVRDVHKAAALAELLEIPLDFLVYSPDLLKPDPALWKSIIGITESPAIDIGHVLKFHTYSFARQDAPGSGMVLNGYGSDQFTGGTARTTLSKIKTGYDSQNYWGEYESQLRKQHAALFLDKWSQSLDEFGAYFNPDYFYGSLPGKNFGSPWLFEVYRQKFQFNYRTVRPEYHLARNSGFDAQFPFLDPRLIEFMTAIPAELQNSLLFDKNLLRKVIGLEPGKAVESAVPKTGIQVRDEKDPTMDYYFELMYNRTGGIIWDLVEKPGAFGPVFDENFLKNEIIKLEKKGNRNFASWLLQIVNTALLYSQLDGEAPAPAETYRPPCLSREAFRENEEEACRMLGIGDDGPDLSSTLEAREDLRVFSEEGNAYKYVSIKSKIVVQVDESISRIIDFIRHQHENPSATVGELLASFDADERADVLSFLAYALEIGMYAEQKAVATL